MYIVQGTIVFSDFKKLCWLDIPGRVDYLTLSFKYSISIGTAPSYICNDFRYSSHSYTTRRRNLSFVFPHVKTQGSKTFKCSGMKLWNDLPLSAKTLWYDSEELEFSEFTV